MRRWILPAGAVLLVLLAFGFLAVSGYADTAPGEAGQPVRIVGPTGQIAIVDHAGALNVQNHVSAAFRAQQYSACGTTARQIIASNANRRDLMIQNLGGPTSSAGAHSNAYLGFGVTGHVALTVNNGWVLHAMTSTITAVTTTDRQIGFGGVTTQLILRDYTGPLSCVAATTGPLGAVLNIIEILR